MFPKKRCSKCNGSGQVFDPMATGKAMKALRVKARIRLREMAYELGCSITLVCHLESGRKPWDQHRINRFKAAIKAIKKATK